MRAGLALRQKWAQEAERARRAADPRLAAQDAAEQAAMRARVRAHHRYGQLIIAAIARGELTHEEAFTRIFDAEERGRVLLEKRRRRIFGD